MRGVATAVVAAIIIGTLYFGREVFVPIALAILLSFVLAPLVRLLQRWHLPRGLSAVGVVLLAFVSIFALGGVIATQVTELAGDLPRYQFTMREKIKSLRGTAAPSGTLERAADVLQDLGKELNKPKEPASLMKRFRRSSRCSRMKITKIAMMPVVVRGWSRGEISAAMLSSAVGGG